MSLTEAIPIATAIVALAVVAAMGWERRRTGVTPLKPLLATIGLTAAAGWASSRTLAALSSATLATAAVMMSAALVVTVPQSASIRKSADGTANTALWSGLLGVALLLIAWRAETSVLVAAVPAIVGVLAVWLGAQTLSQPHASRAVHARAAVEIVIAVALSLAAIACASIAAGCTVLRARPDAAGEALRTLGLATTFALPLALGAGIVLARRVAEVGRGTPSRLYDLIAAAIVLVMAGAALRFQLAKLIVEQTPRPKLVAVAPRIAPTPPRPPVPPTPPPPPAPPEAPDDDAGTAVRTGSSSRVTLGKPAVSGMLAPPEVERAVQKMEKLALRCLEKPESAAAAGKIAVKFTIGPNGSVSNVLDDPETSIDDEKLVACMLASFYQIGFPTPTRGYVRVELPIEISSP